MWAWVIAGALGVVVIGWLVDRLLLAAERHGWVYYRRRRPSRTAVGNAVMSVFEIYAPEQHHTVEESRRYDTDEAADDDPLDPRPARRHPRPHRAGPPPG